MPRFISLLLVCFFVLPAYARGGYSGIGREATPAEIKAWDIDVRPDFAGLPKGSGSAKKGEYIWEEKCASCHGTFAESNEMFPPLVGGTTQEDVKRGRVASLLKREQGRTMLMKLSQISTLWDYINRAMPWNAPKTLSADDVYALTAYILSLGYIVPDDFVLSDGNIADVQKLLPNRNGMTRAHGMWETKGAPDVHGKACMRDCPVDGRIMSELPAIARDAHGNLADQTRIIGPVRGTQTVALAPAAPLSVAASPRALAEQSGCFACHATTGKLVGPAYGEIAAKYRGDATAAGRLVAKVMTGGAGVWGQVAMPPQSNLKADDITALVQWILGEAK